MGLALQTTAGARRAAPKERRSVFTAVRRRLFGSFFYPARTASACKTLGAVQKTYLLDAPRDKTQTGRVDAATFSGDIVAARLIYFTCRDSVAICHSK